MISKEDHAESLLGHERFLSLLNCLKKRYNFKQWFVLPTSETMTGKVI